MEYFFEKARNPLSISITRGEVSNIEMLLACVPVVDLDVYLSPNAKCHYCADDGRVCSEHRLFSAEEWVQKSKKQAGTVGAMVRCARDDLEEYRADREVIVKQHCDLSVLPAAVCELINAYGERPQKRG